jgi:hypothetical protein
MDGKVLFRILAALVLLAAIAGIGFMAFSAGAATHIQVPANAAGQPPYAPYAYGFWRPWPFFGFGCFGPLIALFLLFLAFRAFGWLFWGPRWGRLHHMRRAWRHGWDDETGVPPMFKEWHDRAHGQASQPQDTDKS